MRNRTIETLERLSAGLGLLLCLPLLFVAGVCLAIESGLPVLFRQERVGKGGSPFVLFKLRSMRAGGGNHVTAAGDPRITAVGAFLRKYKIDELPQLWNVFAGEMRFIGPRPEVPSMVDLSDPAWRAILCEKPGLTGISTLVYRNEEKTLEKYSDPDRAYREIVLPHKLELSARYLEIRTPLSDIKLFVLSAWYSFFPAKFDSDRMLRTFVPGRAEAPKPVKVLRRVS
jgi:lipopolysaccharide/colanic/teichoic acid biosynthesis glycosyltransferase